MRPLLLGLLACGLLSAAPGRAARHDRPPERPRGQLADDGRQPLPDADGMERLAREDPCQFIKDCLLRYQRDKIRGYALTMFKEERIAGKLQKPERMKVLFREQPFSVSLKWLAGARKAEGAMYVEGENDGRMIVRPSASNFIFPGARWAAIRAGKLGKDGLAAIDVDGDEARQSGRYPINEFGMNKALERLLTDWEAVQKKGALHVEYGGLQTVPETGGRTCFVLHRTRFHKPERDGITDHLLYIDKDTWLQIGAVVKGADGLIGTYYYRDMTINPEFTPTHFQREAMRP